MIIIDQISYLIANGNVRPSIGLWLEYMVQVQPDLIMIRSYWVCPLLATNGGTFIISEHMVSYIVSIYIFFKEQQSYNLQWTASLSSVPFGLARSFVRSFRFNSIAIFYTTHKHTHTLIFSYLCSLKSLFCTSSKQTSIRV